MSLIHHPRCPYCHQAVQPHEAKAACDGCMAWHHQECWEELSHCAACQASDAVGAGQPDVGPRPERAVQSEVALPKGFRIEDLGTTLKLTRRWFSPIFIFLVFFCIFWDGSLIMAYALMSSAAEIGMLCTLPHVGVGVGLTYYTLLGFVNRTEISVVGGQLSVEHLPLPWPGRRRLRSDEIEQLYCTEVVHRGKNGTSYSYELHALLHDRKPLRLLSGLRVAEQARYVEQELERFLEIEDRLLEGEFCG